MRDFPAISLTMKCLLLLGLLQGCLPIMAGVLIVDSAIPLKAPHREFIEKASPVEIAKAKIERMIS